MFLLGVFLAVAIPSYKKAKREGVPWTSALGPAVMHGLLADLVVVVVLVVAGRIRAKVSDSTPYRREPVRRRAEILLAPDGRTKTQLADEGQQAYEANASQLIGQTLTGVRYFEIAYESAEPTWALSPQVGHCLDFGVDLETVDGSVFGIIWDAEFFQYGIGIKTVSLANHLRRYHVWDVSDNDEWHQFIGSSISRVRVYWSWVETEGEDERLYYPQHLELGFDMGQRIFFSASEYFEDRDVLFPMSDAITVIFDEAVAQRYEIGPYGEEVDRG